MDLKTYNEKSCEICGENAKNLCLECTSYFCEICYKFVHEKKKNIQHKKEEIDHFNPIDIKCPEHPKVPMNLFCKDDQGKINIFIIILISYRTIMHSMFFSE